MNTQPTLFDVEPPLAYIRSSETSKAAAEQAETFAPSQRAKLYDFYVRCGSAGATDKDAHRVTEIARGTICLRRRELIKLGKVEETKDVREGCTVFRVIP